MLSSMDTPTIIIASGQFAALITLFIFVWRADKRSEKRTNDLRVELGTQMGTFVAILLQGQTHLLQGQTQIQTQVGKLQEGQVKLAAEWAGAEIRLKHLEENAVTTQEKIDEIRDLAYQTNAKTANLEGLVRGYLLREHGALPDAIAG